MGGRNLKGGGGRREGWLLPGGWKEGGVAAPRLVELLQGFWSKMRKFIRTFGKRSLKKGILKPKI